MASMRKRRASLMAMPGVKSINVCAGFTGEKIKLTAVMKARKINRAIASVVTKGVGEISFVMIYKIRAAVAAPNSQGKYFANVVNAACEKCSEK